MVGDLRGYSRLPVRTLFVARSKVLRRPEARGSVSRFVHDIPTVVPVPVSQCGTALMPGMKLHLTPVACSGIHRGTKYV